MQATRFNFWLLSHQLFYCVLVALLFNNEERRFTPKHSILFNIKACECSRSKFNLNMQLWLKFYVGMLVGTYLIIIHPTVTENSHRVHVLFVSQTSWSAVVQRNRSYNTVTFDIISWFHTESNRSEDAMSLCYSVTFTGLEDTIRAWPTYG